MYFTGNSSVEGELQEAAFCTQQAYGRALKRLSTSLPFSPRKKKAVITGLAEIIGIKVLREKSATSKIPTALKERVEKLYEREYISYTMPGTMSQIHVFTSIFYILYSKY